MPEVTDSHLEDLESVPPGPSATHPESTLDRRSFLVWAAVASLGASAVFVGATLVQAVVPPSRSIDGKTKPGRVTVARTGGLSIGAPVRAAYGDDAVFVVRTGPDSFSVYNAACPHVGCGLKFDESAKRFTCPCHASTFDLGGRRLSGPAPRDMTHAQFEIVGSDIIVTAVES
ncbi:MAG: ubiquinol-cytochrome c reductase iron-sulfur subunit [Coriobacteriia bacterium]|nr:ubiquinol-cytochrome c reductase iron-sulfur subunit [Coriobacteriia bacterium]